MSTDILDVGDGEALDLGADALDLDTVGELDLASDADSLDLAGGSALDEEPPVTTFEEMHATTVEEVRTAFAQRAAADKARFQDATDSEFWLCLCFQSREQKEAFINAVQWPNVESDDKYVHGEDVASALNIELPPARFVPPEEKVSKDVVQLGVIGEE